MSTKQTLIALLLIVVAAVVVGILWYALRDPGPQLVPVSSAGTATPGGHGYAQAV